MPSALSFLTHFAGDIHQPLHVSYTVDLGGNSFSVKFINNMTNLHLLWDDEMIDYYGKDYMGLASEFISYLQAHPELVSQYQANLDPIDWATESFALTSTTVYNVLPENRKSTTDVDEFGGSLANGNCTFCISVFLSSNFACVLLGNRDLAGDRDCINFFGLVWLSAPRMLLTGAAAHGRKVSPVSNSTLAVFHASVIHI
jgi:hypothetical protein